MDIVQASVVNGIDKHLVSSWQIYSLEGCLIPEVKAPYKIDIAARDYKGLKVIIDSSFDYEEKFMQFIKLLNKAPKLLTKNLRTILIFNFDIFDNSYKNTTSIEQKYICLFKSNSLFSEFNYSYKNLISQLTQLYNFNQYIGNEKWSVIQEADYVNISNFITKEFIENNKDFDYEDVDQYRFISKYCYKLNNKNEDFNESVAFILANKNPYFVTHLNDLLNKDFTTEDIFPNRSNIIHSLFKN